MIRINLLPHREERRKARKTQFIALAVFSLVLGALVVGFVHAAISAQISYQERRNQFLKQQTEILDKQISEIKKLREQTDALMARKTVVENLQTTRSEVVHLMDQLLRILPDGVYLKSIKQTGNSINMVGNAQSNARVSTLMRAIEDSPWLESPTLVEIHALNEKGEQMNQFTLNFTLTKQQPETPAAPVAVASKKG
ncbi:MAG: PilN domain-containing protein [Gallionellaceae bacterium]